MRWLAVLGLVGVGLVGLVAAPAGASSTHDLRGVLTLTESSDGWPRTNTGCSGSGGYSDIAAGAQVKVKDGGGKLLGLSKLGKGGLVATSGTGLIHSCTFAFTVKGVPETKFYGVEVSHRGEVDYSLADLRKSKWTVKLTLGS